MSDAAIETIRTRLRRFQGKYPDICARACLQYSWVSKFASGERGKRPSFDLITKLTTVLDELELEETSNSAHPGHDPNPPARRTSAVQGATADTTEAVLTSIAAVV
jgi:hypothetical protein